MTDVAVCCALLTMTDVALCCTLLTMTDVAWCCVHSLRAFPGRPADCSSTSRCVVVVVSPFWRKRRDPLFVCKPRGCLSGVWLQQKYVCLQCSSVSSSPTALYCLRCPAARPTTHPSFRIRSRHRQQQYQRHLNQPLPPVVQQAFITCPQCSCQTPVSG
jgi:hypothetical protein